MKHQILALSLLGASLQFAPQQLMAQNTYWGLSTMQFSRNNPTTFEGEALQKKVAIHLNAAKMEALKGAKIVGVRMAYATNKVSNFKIFATKSLDGTRLQEKVQTVISRPYTLTDYLFDAPVVVDGSELYVGYEATAQEATRPVCYFDGSHDYAVGTVWAELNGQWTDVSNSGVGAPVMQLIVEGMPQTYNDAVMKTAITSDYYHTGASYAFNGYVYNLGAQPITSLKVRAQLDGAETQEQDITGLNIQPGTEGSVTISNILPTNTGMKSWSVSVLSVNGGADADMSDNDYASSIYVYPEGVQRIMLLEKHTGQGCVNCPAGDVNINRFTKDRDDVVVVAHHSYIQTTYGDEFSMAESDEYRQFFGFSLYPSVSLNRRPVSSSGVAMNDISGTTATVEAMANAIGTLPIPVTVGLQNEFDESTRKGKLTVKIHTYESPSNATHTLNLWLTQDNMIANQVGGTTTYNHSHVFRGTLNGETWGEPVELVPGEDLVKTYDYEIPETIANTVGTYKGQEWPAVPSDMHIVAFVADKTDSPLTNVIYNANTIGVTTNGSTTGMTNVSVSKPQVVVADGAVSVFGNFRQAVVYTMDGKQMARLNGASRVALSKGVYVVRVDGQSTKVVVK